MAIEIRRHPLAEQAAEVILARIGSGEWGLGHKLPGETTLATQFGVGRSTVREAVRELAGRGILESRQGAGVFVLSTDATDDWDTVLRRADIIEVVEGRIAIESEAARLAASRRTPADLRSMRSHLAERVRVAAEGNDEEYIDADTAFHQSVATAAHNAVLSELFTSFVPRIRFAMVDMIRLSHGDHDHRTGVDADAHAAIVDAIRDRSPERAAQVSRSHLTGMREALAR